MRQIVIRATEYSKVYARVEGYLFSIGHINDLTEDFPESEITYGRPYFTQPCIGSSDPAILYELWSRRLEIPKEWIRGNGVCDAFDQVNGMPTCPTCKEVTYGEPRCPFCGQLSKDPEVSND